jgi:hypothetical protein
MDVNAETQHSVNFYAPAMPISPGGVFTSVHLPLHDYVGMTSHSLQAYTCENVLALEACEGYSSPGPLFPRLPAFLHTMEAC